MLNNFVSGTQLLFERRINVGDAVKIGDVEGAVQNMGMRACTVRTWEGAEVIVPNAVLTSDKVTNWTLSDRLRRIDVAVGVAYGTAPETVQDLMLELDHQPDDVPRSAELAVLPGGRDFREHVLADVALGARSSSAPCRACPRRGQATPGARSFGIQLNDVVAETGLPGSTREIAGSVTFTRSPRPQLPCAPTGPAPALSAP